VLAGRGNSETSFVSDTLCNVRQIPSGLFRHISVSHTQID